MSTSDYTLESRYGYCKCGCGQKTRLNDRTRPNKGMVKGEPRLFIAGHQNHNRPDSIRFWEKVALTDNLNECWIYTAGKDPDGYGIFYQKGSSIRAHRYAWIITNGEISNDLNVLHTCDNPSCVNPKHLFLGTVADNNLDKVLKNRQPKGEGMGQHKLTCELVRQIRERYAKGGITQKAMGREYGVSNTLIRLIVIGKAWKHC